MNVTRENKKLGSNRLEVIMWNMIHEREDDGTWSERDEASIYFLNKVIKYFDEIPACQIDQSKGRIRVDDPKPVGDFGAHIARALNMIAHDVHKTPFYYYRDGETAFERALGFGHPYDVAHYLANHGAGWCFGRSDPWPTHPVEVLRSVREHYLETM